MTHKQLKVKAALNNINPMALNRKVLTVSVTQVMPLKDAFTPFLENFLRTLLL